MVIQLIELQHRELFNNAHGVDGILGRLEFSLQQSGVFLEFFSLLIFWLKDIDDIQNEFFVSEQRLKSGDSGFIRRFLPNNLFEQFESGNRIRLNLQLNELKPEVINGLNPRINEFA